jgi:hypothetical protein
MTTKTVKPKHGFKLIVGDEVRPARDALDAAAQMLLARRKGEQVRRIKACTTPTRDRDATPNEVDQIIRLATEMEVKRNAG